MAIIGLLLGLTLGLHAGDVYPDEPLAALPRSDRGGVDLLRRTRVDEPVRAVPARVAGGVGGVPTRNESPTWRLLLGGALITLANILIQWKPKAVTPVA